MEWIDVGAVLVAIVAALGAWVAQRSASKAIKTNTMVSGRLDAEKEAYERARVFDTQTIDRQNKEIDRLREENHKLRNDLASIKLRVSRLEHVTPEFERLLREQFPDVYDQE